MKSIDAAAYRAGEELRGEGAEIVHDYTRKKGVVHKEIILPDNAPPEFNDRETLWNAVEARERRIDARLAREIEVALQKEFDLEEQKNLLREYIRENFVDKGMIADFVIHDKQDGNPHSHIMLTTRHVTPDGFKGKNRDWDKDFELIKWRENWANVNNRKFEQKGLAERIDHRTLKAQGIDREPTIHMGAQAWAMEKKGIRTERGDMNREIKRRNDERAANLDSPAESAASGVRNQTSEFAISRAAKRAEKEQKIAEIVTRINNVRNAPKNSHDNAEPADLITARRSLREIEEHLKAEKAAQIVEKLYAKREARREETEKFAQHMTELKENYIATYNYIDSMFLAACLLKWLIFRNLPIFYSSLSCEKLSMSA